MPALHGIFRNRAFVVFGIGEAISVLGDQFYLLALPWITLLLTGSPAALGTVLMAAAIPRALLMPVGGLLVDRFSPQGVLLVSNTVRGLVVAVFTLLWARDSLTLSDVYLLCVAFGAADALAYPAFMSITPRLVDNHQLEAANAVVQGTSQLATMIGPAIAGVVVASVGVSLALAIDTASFAISVLSLLVLLRLLPARAKPAEPAAPVADAPPGPSLREAVRFVFVDPVLRTVLVILAAMNFGVLGPLGAGLPALVAGPLEGGAITLGLVMGTVGAGTLAGMLTAAFTPRPDRPGPATSWACGLLALGIGGVTFTALWPQLLPLMLLCLFVAGAALGYLNVQGISWLQVRVPQVMMGRVMAIMVLSANGLGPISYAVAGQVAASSLPALFAGAGVAISLAFWATRARSFRAASMSETLAALAPSAAEGAVAT